MYFSIISIFIDRYKYFNYFKIKSQFFTKDIILKPFDSLKGNYLCLDFGTSKISQINNNHFINIHGFEPISTDSLEKKIPVPKTESPTLSLYLYSLEYANDYLVNELKNNNGKLSSEQFSMIRRIYLIIAKEVNKIPSFDQTINSEHVISERVIFCANFLSYILKNNSNDKLLIDILNKDLKQSMYFLTDNRFFIWQTNHGLIQVDALLKMRKIIDDKTYIIKIDKLIDERLNNLIDYFLGQDGAVFEGASGYWMFIQKLFNDIYEDLDRSSSMKIPLQIRLKMVQKFIDTVVARNGFLQGSGDSYSQYMPINPSINQKNVIYRFSNKLVGVSFNNDSNQISFQLISLDTPPQVHKLPEDLAFLFYSNSPIFINAGQFGYSTDLRNKVISEEKYHSTVSFLDSKELAYSNVFIKANQINSESYLFNGFKTYKDSSKITRNVLFQPKLGRISITDSSSNRELLISRYILSPDIKVNKLNDTIILTTNKNKAVKLLLSKEFEINKTMISPSAQKIIETNVIEIKGLTNKLVIILDPTSKFNNTFELLNSLDNSDHRKVIAKYFDQKYGAKYNIDRNYIVIFLSLYLLYIILFAIVFGKLVKFQQK